MDVIIKVFPIFYSGVCLLMFYSVIRWVAVFIADRNDIKRRKKYAWICLACMGIMVLAVLVGFIMTLRRNTM
jgi:cytochrome bd-type quinol oxidase subunit 1